MELDTRPDILLVTEASGGHLIPALEAAKKLVVLGSRVTVWCALRLKTESLANGLIERAKEKGVNIVPVISRSNLHPMIRMIAAFRIWRKSSRSFRLKKPDVVVGFGGWISASVLMAAKFTGGIRTILHEQNVEIGRANRWMLRYVDCIAVSFYETQMLNGKYPIVVTGMPVRKEIGSPEKSTVMSYFGFQPDKKTILILGGSQGSASINNITAKWIDLLSEAECDALQFIHLTGSTNESKMKSIYEKRAINAWVAPHLAQIEKAYAAADLVVGRAGASTIMELARCGKPSILIPYPYAQAHQRANAKLAEIVGAALMVEESDLSPEKLLNLVRSVLMSESQKSKMSFAVRSLDIPDATDRLAQVIIGGRTGAPIAEEKLQSEVVTANRL